MGTDLNRLSIEANPPFVIAPQNQLIRQSSQLRLRTEIPAFPQVDSEQRLQFIHFEVWRAAETEPPSPSHTTSDQIQAAAMPLSRKKSVWDILESLAGTIEAPADWAAEHDHYLYGTPKRR